MNWDKVNPAHQPYLAYIDAGERALAVANSLYQVNARYGHGFVSAMDMPPVSAFRTKPACNCRNCGAPFEPAETACSYCRSER